MIRSLTIQDGLLQELLGNKTINFNSEINLIWGKNGTGKTSILKSLAHYSCIGRDRIISSYCKDSHNEMRLDGKESTFEEILNRNAPTGKSIIDWDGSPSVYLSIEERAGKKNMFHQHQIDDIRSKDDMYYTDTSYTQKLLSFKDIASSSFFGRSSGETVILLMNRIREVELPDISHFPLKKMSNTAQKEAAQKFVEYVRAKTNTGKPTLLLDEPDRNLDYENQFHMHYNVIPELAKTFQVIVVSHCPFAFMEGTNIIDIDGTANGAQNLFAHLPQVWNKSFEKEEKEK